MPEVLFYDPDCFATTPTGVLTASAMNGFDKALETLYSRSTDPVADAHALYALRFLRTGLRGLAEADAGDEALHRSIVGMILAQYPCQPNVIHAFGNGVSRHFDVQQGAVHGMVAPAVLRWVFEVGDGRRRLLAEGLGVDPDEYDHAGLAERVIEEVTAIRDALGLPSQLRSVDGLERAELPEIAAVTAENFHFSMAPPDLEPDRERIESVLRAAW
jgi:alcohol dehydrogenase class IV